MKKQKFLTMTVKILGEIVAVPLEKKEELYGKKAISYRQKMAQEEITKNKEKSMRFTIGTKLVLTIVAIVIIGIAFLLIYLLNSAEKVLSQSTKNTMLGMATAYKEVLVLQTQEDTTDYEIYSTLLSETKVVGAESSYAYLVDKDGMMLYHPTAEKVGSAVENEVVKGLVAEIQSGKTPADSVTSYLFKGVIKYASYAVLPGNRILVITADEDDIFSPLKQIQTNGIIASIVILFICIAAGTVLSFRIVKPIKDITVIISKTGDFNFTRNKNSGQLSERRDETGLMARAVHNMRTNLRQMVADINGSSKTISENVEKLKLISNEINGMCVDNSATTQELAAGMQETSATTETINASIGVVQSEAKNIRELTVKGDALSNEILDRAEKLKKTTADATNRTTSMYQEVKSKTASAIESSKGVSKINELTEAIMAISSQTSLLALNASIEAARAGEAGRGFSVVATEIGNLASQTSSTVNSINQIVKEVNVAVANMTKSLEDTTVFLENTVLVDYGQFKEVGEQYSSDATVIKASMGTIQKNIAVLGDTIDEVSEALLSINSTVNESTVGITEIATKTSDVVVRTEDNYQIVNECLACVEKLKEIVSVFKME